MGKRAVKKASPSIFQQMTADRARRIVYAVYAGGVCCESRAEFDEIRAGLKDPIRFACPGDETGDRWGMGPCETGGEDVAEPLPPRVDSAKWTEFLLRQEGVDPVRAWAKSGERDEDALMWSPGRLSLATALESLPEGHDLLGPLLRADDALSDWMAVYRWARALAYHWGVDGARFARMVDEHMSRQVAS